MCSSVSVTALELSCGFPFSQCAAHGNAEFIQTILGLVLRLVGLGLISVLLSLAPSDQFRTETTSLLTTCCGWSWDRRTFFCVFDETLNSSMMFSSLFTVVQSPEPHSDDFFFCVSASSPIPVADFLFTCSCNPPVHPSSVVPCHSAPLRAVHLTCLPLLDMNSRRL